MTQEYAAALEVDLCFQGFDHELEELPKEYGPPGGAFFLALDDGRAVGCAGLRRFSDSAGEIKRLYVVPASRKRGVARALTASVIARAKGLGYARLLLDTLPFMVEARALYSALGFKLTAPYRFEDRQHERPPAAGAPGLGPVPVT